ncbi:MAG: ubiquitin-like domain-containing protein [bacterium]|nr:ubiquitin-like domain-containing protein [bacterium]
MLAEPDSPIPLNEEATRPGTLSQLKRPKPRRSAGLSLMIAVLIVSLGTLLMVVFQPASPPPFINITLRIDDQESHLRTQARTVAELLRTYNVALEANDTITPGLLTLLEDGMVVEIRRARLVSLTVNGSTSLLRTSLENPAAILRSAGLTLNDADHILLDGEAAVLESLAEWPRAVSEIVVQRGIELTVVDDGQTQRIYTTAGTVGEALFQAGITVFLADTVTPEVTAPVEAGMQIVIERAQPITIQVDGITLETRTTTDSVSDALAEARIALNGEDYTLPAADQPITPAMTIRVIRVREELLSEILPIPFETHYQVDTSLPAGEQRLVQAGREGTMRRDYRVRYENQTEVSRTVEVEVIGQEAVDEVIVHHPIPTATPVSR